MANRVKGEVSVAVDDRTLKLVYTTNSLCELEDMSGSSIGDIVQMVNGSAGSVGLKTLRLLFWSALIEHQEGISIKEAGVIMDQIGAAAAGELIGRAMNLAFPAAEPAEKKATASKD